jgi:hypothetical protein
MVMPKTGARMTEPIELAYKVDHDLDYLHPDLEKHGYILSGQFPPERENLSPTDIIDVYDLAPLQIPTPLRMGIFGNDVVDIDYPYFGAPGFPVMSKRMVYILRSVGEFAHQTYPIEAEDMQVIGKDPETGAMVTTGVTYDNFVLMHLTEHIDALDWENSICERDPDLPHQVKQFSLKKLVITPPPGGLPPLFRLSAKRTRLFVSAAAKAALEDAGIRGVRYTPQSRVR